VPGTFTLTEAASKYGVDGFDSLAYFEPWQVSQAFQILLAHYSTWTSGQHADFTLDAGSGFHYVFSGSYASGIYYLTPGVQSKWAGMYVDTIVLQSAGGDTLAVFDSAPTHEIYIDSHASSFLAPMRGTTYLTGNSANDVFRPGAYAQTVHVDGGAGFDVVDLTGIAIGPYPVTLSTPTLLNGLDGTFYLDSQYGGAGFGNFGVVPTNVERIVADDWAVAYDLHGNAGLAYRLYQAAFDRQPDLPGLGFQINALDQGFALHDVAQNFLNSPEFQSLYGAHVSDEAYITALYGNVLHRAPDTGGYAYQLDALKTYDRAQLLVNFSESPENQANVIGQIQAGILYIPIH